MLAKPNSNCVYFPIVSQGDNSQGGVKVPTGGNRVSVARGRSCQLTLFDGRTSRPGVIPGPTVKVWL